jgi:hypothetical protein
MTMLEPCLPLRTCSNCKSWGLPSSFTGGAIVYVEDAETGLMRTICQVHLQIRSGGETCGSFLSKENSLRRTNSEL